MTDTTIT